jgi:hypothetical protein
LGGIVLQEPTVKHFGLVLVVKVRRRVAHCHEPAVDRPWVHAEIKLPAMAELFLAKGLAIAPVIVKL